MAEEKYCMAAQEHMALVERWFRDILAGESEVPLEVVLEEVLTPDFISYDPSNRVRTLGIDGFRAWIEWYQSTFRDPQWLVHDLIADGEKLVVRYSGLLTYCGGLFDIPAQEEQRVKEMGTLIFQLKENKIHALWSAICDLDLVMALGVMPVAHHEENPVTTWAEEEEHIHEHAQQNEEIPSCHGGDSVGCGLCQGTHSCAAAHA